MFSAAILTILATAFISVVPIGILLFVPEVLKGRSSDKRTQASRGVMLVGTRLNVLLCFAAGSLLSDALLHILAQSVFGDFPSLENTRRQISGMITGLATFFILDLLVRYFTGHCNHLAAQDDYVNDPILLQKSNSLSLESSSPIDNGEIKRRVRGNNLSPNLKMLSTGKTSPSPERLGILTSGFQGNSVLNLIADAVHNFTDGLALATAFARDYRLGLTTTLAVFFHEIPHELGDYAVLIKAGYKHGKVIQLQLLTALGAFCGAVLGIIIHSDAISGLSFIDEQLLLPFAAGGFVYVALCNILPEVLSDISPRSSIASILGQIFAFFAGIGLMSLID